MATNKSIKMQDKEALIEMVIELQGKLKKKKLELHRTRKRLNDAKVKLSKMKDTVQFQRDRILQLYTAPMA